MKKLFFIFWTGIILISASTRAQIAELSRINVNQLNDEVTLSLETRTPTKFDYTLNTLASDPMRRLNRRYYIDLSPIALIPGFQCPAIGTNSKIQRVRCSQYEKDKIRIVFDMISNDETKFFFQKSARGLQISTAELPAIDTPPPVAAATEDKSEEDLAAIVKSLQASQEAPKKKVISAPPLDTKEQKIRIIVDAGHGGDDPGAHGKKGNLEKNVTLDIARDVRQVLSKYPKYEVFMTRDKDTTLELLDRTKFANQMGGNLFVSIHANASPKRDAKGISTYFLNNADDQESLRVAMRENGELDPSLVGQKSKNSDDYYLEVMKASMIKNFHTAQSTDLARAVQMDLIKSLRKDYSDINDLGVRSARFYVLTGATMPAILVETSFISNPTEEKRLSNEKYQMNLASAIVDGIETFLKNSPDFESAHPVFISNRNH